METQLTQELFNNDPQKWRQTYEARLRARAERRKQRLANDPVAQEKQYEQGRKWRANNPTKVQAHNEELKARARKNRELYRTLVHSDSTGVN
jgi:hypothetical protein